MYVCVYTRTDSHTHSLFGNEDLLLSVSFLLSLLYGFMVGFALVNLFVKLLAVLRLLGLLGRSHRSLLEHVRRVELITAGHLLAVPDVSHGQVEGCHFLALLSVLPVTDLKEKGKTHG